MMEEEENYDPPSTMYDMGRVSIHCVWCHLSVERDGPLPLLSVWVANKKIIVLMMEEEENYDPPSTMYDMGRVSIHGVWCHLSVERDGPLPLLSVWVASASRRLVDVFLRQRKMKEGGDQVTGRLFPRQGSREMRTLADRVLYARNRNGRCAVTGGTPISEESAMALRCVVFGTAMCPPRSEWTRTGLGPKEYTGYQITCPRNTTRGLLTVLQAEIVKHLLFDKANPKGEPPDRLLNVGYPRFHEALVSALCSILWRVGEKTTATLCLPQEKIYLYQSMEYYQDGITEKLHVFEVTNYDDLEIMVKRYAHLFLEEPGPGALLLLYSCILTRGPKKVEKDMDGRRSMLVGLEEEGSLCLVTLLLTGRATPYLHNGVIYVGDEDHYAVPRFGILARNEIGLLIHSEQPEEDGEANTPGSRLKTPSLPIWVVLVSGQFAVFFNTNRELLHNYHAERRFELTYLSCGGGRYLLTVDTRQGYSGYGQSEEITVPNVAGVEKVIQSKWPDAFVTWQNLNSNR